MSIPINNNPEKSQGIGKLPNASPPVDVNKITPQPIVSRDTFGATQETLLGSSIGSLGQFLNLDPESPVLSNIESFLQSSTSGNEDAQNIIQASTENIKEIDSEVLEIKDFYQIIGKLFPIATSFLGNINSNVKDASALLENSLIEVVVEIQNQISNNPEIVDFPKELKDFILTIDLKNPESFKAIVEFLDNLENKSLISAKIDEPKAKVNHLLEHFSSTIRTLNALESFTGKQKSEVLLLLMGSQSIKSQGMIGENLTKLNEGMTDLTINIASQLDLLPKDKLLAAKTFISGVFDHFLLSGILMGKALVLTANGKLLNPENSHQLQQILLEKKEEMKIFDQIPFSFLAFFAPFEDMQYGASNAVNIAKASLMNLIRVMLRVVFMLLAIQTGGPKLGENGIDLLLSENADYLSKNIQDLTFALKKVDEAYGVNVKHQIEHAESAREHLLSEKYPDFWSRILKIFVKDTNLANFLKETKDADPLYEAIHTLVNKPKINDTSIHLQSQG